VRVANERAVVVALVLVVVGFLLCPGCQTPGQPVYVGAVVLTESDHNGKALDASGNMDARNRGPETDLAVDTSGGGTLAGDVAGAVVEAATKKKSAAVKEGAAEAPRDAEAVRGGGDPPAGK